MTEYINKQKVLDYLNGYLHSLGEGGADDLLFDRGQRRALINTIQDLLAVKSDDVQPVKHGRWNEIYHDSENYSASCSYCQEPTVRRVWFRPYDFCPHCGARMDLKEGEKDGRI